MSIERGQGVDAREELTRSDLVLIERALRQDWPIAPERRARILERLVSYLDLTTEEGASAPDRTVIAAARALAQFCGLSLRQAELDLKRELALSGRGEEALDLEKLVEEAERRAAERQRGGEARGPPG